MIHSCNKKTGYILSETLVYVSLFALLSLFLMNTISNMTGISGSLSKQREIVRDADLIHRRYEREIHRAKSVSVVANPPRLMLDTGVEFFISGDSLYVRENSADSPLSSSGITIMNLNFSLATTSRAQAVRMEFELGGKHFETSSLIAGGQ